MPMPPSRTLLTLCTIFALASLVALGLSHLALTDISHGEGDLAAEWLVLRLSAAVVLALATSTLVLVRQSAKKAV